MSDTVTYLEPQEHTKITVHDISNGETITRNLRRSAIDENPDINWGTPTVRDELTPVSEGELIIAALKIVNAEISKHEIEILTNPSGFSSSEYKGISDYQWWRLSELGAAALEVELKNFEIIYPTLPPKGS